MNSSEQESFEGQSQNDSPDNMAAGGGNTGTPEASNDGGAGQTSAVTPDMLFTMMQRMQEQTAVLQQHILNASGSQSTGKFTLESESYNPTWSYRLKWDATKQSLKEWFGFPITSTCCSPFFPSSMSIFLRNDIEDMFSEKIENLRT